MPVPKYGAFPGREEDDQRTSRKRRDDVLSPEIRMSRKKVRGTGSRGGRGRKRSGLYIHRGEAERSGANDTG